VPSPPASATNVARAVALLTACALPGFLSGSLVAQIRDDFPLGEVAIGLSFSTFWGVAAAASTPAAKVVERIGSSAAMRLAGAIAAGAAGAIALWVDSGVSLVVLLAVGGLSMALATPGANALLVRAVPPRRRALAFGLSQSSPPAALLLAGLAVPTVAAPLGWRPVFVGSALLAIGAAALVPGGLSGTRSSASPVQEGAPDLRPLALVMCGVTLGNAALGALNAFLVAAAPSAGVSGSAAAVTLAVGSALTIPLRIWLGGRADRRGGTDPLPTVVALLAAGAAGFALVATQASWLFLGGALLVLVFGWGWIGLFTYAVVTRYLRAPETATGVMQTGFYAGGVFGPVGFGLLVETGSFTLGWITATVATLAAAAAVMVARRTLPPHRVT
jgi:MFS family permease